jgi:hypothetical protein
MKTFTVSGLLERGIWSLVGSDIDSPNPFILRFRTPVLMPAEVESHPIRLAILWPFADEDSRALPDSQTQEAMQLFEDRVCAAFESDGLAVLTAALTFDGARQWLFYTGDLDECGRRLNTMPQEPEPYPIELVAAADPGWNYLRDEFLRVVNPSSWNEGR